MCRPAKRVGHNHSVGIQEWYMILTMSINEGGRKSNAIISDDHGIRDS